jgi:hypothetical protein
MPGTRQNANPPQTAFYIQDFGGNSALALHVHIVEHHSVTDPTAWQEPAGTVAFMTRRQHPLVSGATDFGMWDGTHNLTGVLSSTLKRGAF